MRGIMRNKNKVIVIEDDKDINQLIAYNLKKEGFCVEQIYDGFLAQEKLNKEHFGIVILDIMLPGIDGFDLCKEFNDNENYFKTFFIIVSAKNSEQDKLYAHILGADLYFTKPFDVKALVSAVKEIDSMQRKEFTVSHK